jgi:hypothetical protein
MKKIFFLLFCISILVSANERQMSANEWKVPGGEWHVIEFAPAAGYDVVSRVNLSPQETGEIFKVPLQQEMEDGVAASSSLVPNKEKSTFRARCIAFFCKIFG